MRQRNSEYNAYQDWRKEQTARSKRVCSVAKKKKKLKQQPH